MFHLWMVWNWPIFLAAVFLSAFDFSETFQHASSALIFFASDHIFDLTWFIRSDDISLLWSDLVYFMYYCFFLLERIKWTLWSDDVWTLDLECGFVLFEANIVTDNFFVVICKMDYEGHLLNVNKVFTIFFFGKKRFIIQEWHHFWLAN